MFVEILIALVLYKLFRYFILPVSDDDRLHDNDFSETEAIFAVASRLERVYGGKAYVGLRIPDPEIEGRQHIDLVLVTKRAMMVVAVRNLSGFVEAGRDGCWVCIKDAKSRPQTCPDPVTQIHKQVEILKAYLEHRGVDLPKGHMIGKVILPNPNCRVALSIVSQPEIFSYDEWIELKPSDSKAWMSSWFKERARDDLQDKLYQNLQFVLNTAPMWDRLVLEGDRHILGELIEYKGTQEDMQALRSVKRSRVGQLVFQNASMFGLGRSRIPVLYIPRDYRSEGTSSAEWMDVSVKPSTQVLFQPFNSKKPKKFKITSILSISLSA